MRLPLFCVCLMLASPAFAQSYDLVIEGGRVMDPETGLDAVRNVGISQGKIVRVAADELTGKRVIEANGLIEPPGFINLHEQRQAAASSGLKAFDGVTTGLEM